MKNPVDYVPDPPPGPRMRARDAIVVIAVAALLLLLAKGDYVREWGEGLRPGLGRGVVLAVGTPAGWLADQLPVAEVADEATSWFASNESVGGDGGFSRPSSDASDSSGIQPITPSSFDPAALDDPPRKRKLGKLLITGDSMTQPMDAEIARRLADDDVEVERDIHQGTAITQPRLLNWGKLAQRQAGEEPDAVVVLLGGGEGFALEDARGRKVECCGPDHAALYADRVRQMMRTYRRGGKTKVYWLLIPEPKGKPEGEVVHMVNASIDVASVPYRRDVRVVDLGDVLSPNGEYKNSLEVDGRREIVRETDGLHLTAPGSKLAADKVMQALERDFTH